MTLDYMIDPEEYVHFDAPLTPSDVVILNPDWLAKVEVEKVEVPERFPMAIIMT